MVALDDSRGRDLDRDRVLAARKGHSFIGYFIFSLIFFPLALIVAYVVSDKTATATATTS
jgi:hypothetical protein